MDRGQHSELPQSDTAARRQDQLALSRSEDVLDLRPAAPPATAAMASMAREIDSRDFRVAAVPAKPLTLLPAMLVYPATAGARAANAAAPPLLLPPPLLRHHRTAVMSTPPPATTPAVSPAAASLSLETGREGVAQPLRRLPS